MKFFCVALLFSLLVASTFAQCSFNTCQQCTSSNGATCNWCATFGGRPSFCTTAANAGLAACNQATADASDQFVISVPFINISRLITEIPLIAVNFFRLNINF